MKHIQTEVSKLNQELPTYWFHAASLGEYGNLRPFIKALRAQKNCNIILTFFSPTAIEALSLGKTDADLICYLPLDTRAHAKALISSIRPKAVFFSVSEYWINYLTELHKQSIPTYLISAFITKQSVFFHWYGSLHRQCLSYYKQIFVADTTSVLLLKKLGINNITLCGDPLFDNVLQKADTEWSDAIIEHFSSSRNVFIAGSIHDKKDLDMVIHLANAHPDQKMIFVPHEIVNEEIQATMSRLKGISKRYTDCTEGTQFNDTQILIIDVIGMLAYVYRYARWAYIGGGFTPYLHSLIEATVYGLPVSFGPCIERKSTAKQLIDLGVGQIVRDAAELEAWFTAWQDEEKLQQTKTIAKSYALKNKGATEVIINKTLV